MLTQIFLIVVGYLDDAELLVSGHVCVRLLDDDSSLDDDPRMTNSPEVKDHPLDKIKSKISPCNSIRKLGLKGEIDSRLFLLLETVI